MRRLLYLFLVLCVFVGAAFYFAADESLADATLVRIKSLEIVDPKNTLEGYMANRGKVYSAFPMNSQTAMEYGEVRTFVLDRIEQGTFSLHTLEEVLHSLCGAKDFYGLAILATIVKKKPEFKAALESYIQRKMVEDSENFPYYDYTKWICDLK